MHRFTRSQLLAVRIHFLHLSALMLKPELLRWICVSSPICVTQSFSLRWSPLISVTSAECKREKFSILLVVETLSTHRKSIFLPSIYSWKSNENWKNAYKHCSSKGMWEPRHSSRPEKKACDSWGLSKNHILWESCAFLDLMQWLWRQNNMYKPEFNLFFYTAQACNGSSKN